MKANGFRITAMTFGLSLICVVPLQPVYAGSDVKESSAKTGNTGKSVSGGKSASAAPAGVAVAHAAADQSHANGSKAETRTPAIHEQPVANAHAAAHPQNNVASGEQSGTGLTGSELTGSELTGSELTGSTLTGTERTGTELTGTELTGTELTGSTLTGSQLTGFTGSFGSPYLSSPPPAFDPTFFDQNSSDSQREHRHRLPSDEARSNNPPSDAIAPVAGARSAVPTYNRADIQLRSAQTDYDAALARVRQNNNTPDQQVRVRAGEHNQPSPTTSPIDHGSTDAVMSAAEIESRAVAADPEANAARQKLDEAVMTRDNAERAQAAPHATASH